MYNYVVIETCKSSSIRLYQLKTDLKVWKHSKRKEHRSTQGNETNNMEEKRGHDEVNAQGNKTKTLVNPLALRVTSI